MGTPDGARSGHQEYMTVHKLRENVFQEYEPLKEKELETEPKASCGYGGKLSVEQDSMDKSAVHHEYQSKLSKHYLQVDPNQGFGSKFGIQVDRVDQLAVGFDYQGKTGKHASQKDYSSGLGGKYGPAGQPWRQERDGLRLQGKTEKHGLQKDYSRSLRGKNGIDQARCIKGLAFSIKAKRRSRVPERLRERLWREIWCADRHVCSWPGSPGETAAA